MDKGKVLKDFSRSAGIMMGVLLSINAVISFLQNGFFGSLLPMALCLAAWLTAFEQAAGAVVAKIVMIIKRVVMYVLLAAVVVLACFVLYLMIRENAFDGVLPLILITGVGVGVTLFFAGMYRHAAYLASDLACRLGSNNSECRILMHDQIGLSKFIVTILVFQCIGFAGSLLASAGPLSYLFDMVRGIVLEYLMSMGDAVGSVGYSLIGGLFNYNAFGMFVKALNIVLSACSLAYIAKYRRVITG